MDFKVTPGWVELYDVEHDYKKLFNKNIDMVEAGGINKYVKPYIIPDIITLYGKKPVRDYFQIVADIVGDKSPDLVKNVIVTYLALLKALETIGEACKNLAEEFKKSHPEIPWTQIVNFRTHTTHEYWNVKF